MRFPLVRSPFPALNLPLLEHGLLLLCEQLSPAALPVSSPPCTVAATHCFWSTWYAPAPSMPKPITAYAWPWKARGGVSGGVGGRGSPSKMGRFCRPSWRQRAPNPNALNPRMEARRDMVCGTGGGGGGGGGVGGGSEKVRVSQAAPAPIGVFQNAASSFVHLIRPIHLTSVFLFSPHPSSTHNHEAHSSRPLWHAPT